MTAREDTVLRASNGPDRGGCSNTERRLGVPIAVSGAHGKRRRLPSSSLGDPVEALGRGVGDAGRDCGDDLVLPAGDRRCEGDQLGDVLVLGATSRRRRAAGRNTVHMSIATTSTWSRQAGGAWSSQYAASSAVRPWTWPSMPWLADRSQKFTRHRSATCTYRPVPSSRGHRGRPRRCSSIPGCATGAGPGSSSASAPRGERVVRDGPGDPGVPGRMRWRGTDATGRSAEKALEFDAA
jgi:hypothetical protein